MGEGDCRDEADGSEHGGGCLVDAESGNVNVLGCRGSALVLCLLGSIEATQSILADGKG